MCIIPFSHFIFHSQDLSSRNPLKAVSCQRQSDKLTWKKYSSTLYPSAFLSLVLFTSSSSCFPSYLFLLLWIHGGFKPPHPDVDSSLHICFFCLFFFSTNRLLYFHNISHPSTCGWLPHVVCSRLPQSGVYCGWLSATGTWWLFEPKFLMYLFHLDNCTENGLT